MLDATALPPPVCKYIKLTPKSAIGQTALRAPQQEEQALSYTQVNFQLLVSLKVQSLNNFGGMSEKVAELLPWVSSVGPLQQRKQAVVLQRCFCREERVTPVSERWLLPTEPLLILRWLLSKSQRQSPARITRAAAV